MTGEDTGKLVVVGCGAATERFYLPALSARPELASRVLFLDLDMARAAELGARIGAKAVSSLDQAATEGAVAAILATPHHLHHRQALAALDLGMHLLIEKPVTISAGEAREIADKGEATGRLVMVNNNRRLFPAFNAIHALVRSGELGQLTSGEFLDGSEFEWPTVTGFYLTSPEAKGVLLDRGAHTVDIMTWWLGDDLTISEALHDGFAGADATFHLTARTPNGAPIALKFSRLVKLPNSYELVFENGAIRGKIFSWDKYERRGPRGPWTTVSAPGFNPKAYNDFVFKMTDLFLDAVFAGAKAPLTVRDVIPSIALIEQAYAQAIPFSLPWYDEWKAKEQ